MPVVYGACLGDDGESMSGTRPYSTILYSTVYLEDQNSVYKYKSTLRALISLGIGQKAKCAVHELELI